MFFLVLRKITNNKWLMACLLIGSILAVAMVSSIPLYTDGILQRMLTKDMEQFQTDTGYYPGRYVMELNAYTYYQGKSRVEAYNWFNNRMESQLADKLRLPYQKVNRLGLDYMTFEQPSQDGKKLAKTYTKLYGITDFEKHVEIVAGRLPLAQSVDGVYEVIATEKAQNSMNILLGQELTLTDETKQIEPVKVRIVGLYRRPAAADAWWSEGVTMYETAFLMNFDQFNSTFVQGKKAIVSAYWYFALDYTKLKVEDLKAFTGELAAQKLFMNKYQGTKWEFPAQKILDQYDKRADQLKLTLWVLQAPILLMLAFYIFMVSQLIIENDRNEIAVMKSRGASAFQVFGSYLLQSALLSGVSVAVGPIVAMFICRVLGASNGFLELVSRTALPLSMNINTVLYAVYAGCFSVVMMMIPAVRATKVTIVEHKQKKGRRWKAPLWQKMFLDLILLGASLYGLYQYSLRQETILVSAIEGMSVPVDPFLFIISTAFVVGAGLLFLRIYPSIIRLISWAGRRIWTPAMYTSFVQVGRSGGREQFLMLFLILTVAIGIFSANSARTINQNVEDKERYAIGADITLQMDWPSDEVVDAPAMGGPAMGPQSDTSISNNLVTFQEPDFAIYSKLAGTKAAARVFLPTEPLKVAGQARNFKTGALMAIVADEFGGVVWSADDLLPHHINEYLNLMALSPDAVLVSEQLMKDLSLKVGDPITYSWGEQNEMDGVIYASVPYWPGLNPYETDSKYFVIGNLNYVQAQTRLEPYQLWFKRADGSTTKQIYDDITAKNMDATWIVNTEQEVVKRKNDPLLQGTNGALTLGFIVTLAISMIGFFIYWILSIQSRTLQFGIFRAMGMSAGRVIFSLVLEQVMISGVAILMGLIIGGVMSELFVPLLGLVYSAAQQVPPFMVVASRADYVRIYTVVGAMLAAGLALLGVLVSRIKVSQAIKLGED